MFCFLALLFLSPLGIRLLTLIFICLLFVVRLDLNTMREQYEKGESDLKAVQNVGQIIGEVLKRLDNDRCMYI